MTGVSFVLRGQDSSSWFVDRSARETSGSSQTVHRSPHTYTVDLWSDEWRVGGGGLTKSRETKTWSRQCCKSVEASTLGGFS